MVSWKDNRPPLEQVKSGFKIVGAMLLSLAAFVMFSKGCALVTANPDRQVTLGWTLLIVTAAALFVTVRYWAGVFFAVVAYCALRSTILVVLIVVGLIRDIKLWSTLALCISLWLMAAASYRFHDQKLFSLVDQFALTSAVLLLFLALVKIATSGVNAGVPPFTVALLVLAVPASFGLINSSRSKR